MYTRLAIIILGQSRSPSNMTTPIKSTTYGKCGWMYLCCKVISRAILGFQKLVYCLRFHVLRGKWEPPSCTQPPSWVPQAHLLEFLATACICRGSVS